MKGVIFFLAIALAAWMAGAEYVWLCHVKSHCGTGSATEASLPANGLNGAAPVAESDRPALASARGSNSAPATINEPGPAEVTATLTEPEQAPEQPSRPQVSPAGEALPPNTTTNAAPMVGLEVDGKSLFTPRAFGYQRDQWQIRRAANGSDLALSLSLALREREALELTIIGQYFGDEAAPDSFDNTGLARARSLRDALVEAGIARDRLTHSSQRLDNTELQPGYVLSAVDVTPLLTRRSLYFDTASAAPRSSSELDQYVSEIAEFLTQHRGASVRITGHTDNTGETDGNEALGLRRARQVAELLGTRGLPTTRIRIGSRGQNEPVANNSTAAGRAANRRVEIQLDMGRR